MLNHIRNTIDELDYLYDANDIYEAIELAYSEGDIGEFEMEWLLLFLDLKTFQFQGSDKFDSLYYHILNL